MSCREHQNHEHSHGPSCGHQAISHEGHTDYLHDGHLHHVHDQHVDEHTLSNETNGSECTTGHSCSTHDASHEHGQGCGHEAVPHGDHTDYLVSGHLHNRHEGHCDTHGSVNSEH